MDIKTIETVSRKYGIPVIRSESHELLQNFVLSSKPNHILEIGTAVGFSGIIMLENSTADLLTIEHDPELAKKARENFKQAGLLSRVTIKREDCLVELAKMINSKKFDDYFDFIFLDGPKAQYLGMIDALLVLLKSGGVLIADNVLFRGYVTEKSPNKRYKTIAKRLDDFIKKCKTSPFLTKFQLFNTEDGIIYAEKV